MSGGFWLITSGAYIGQELAAEFGRMPPAFLPVGTRRLYEAQLERIGSGRPVYLTLPETYPVPAEDQRRLAALGVAVLSVPDGLSLGESVIFALNLIGGPDQPVWILHGDTLVDPAGAAALDQIGIASSGEGYSWAEVELQGDAVIGIETVVAGRADDHQRPIACGYFAFAHTTALVRGITRARGDFIAGILDYSKAHPLTAVSIDSWHDFGHVQTFFRSRRIVTSARHFNALRIDGRTARKTSSDVMKIRAEAAWFQSVPPPLRIYTARLVDSGDDADGRAFYETEYGYLPTLAELFVFGGLGSAVWSRVLRSCEEFLAACVAASAPEPADPLLRELAIVKTVSRLRVFADQTGFDVDGALRYASRPAPSLMRIAEEAAARLGLGSDRRACVMHGDFCFSNILYDSRVQRIHVIDPRGYVRADQPSTNGDLRYDMAKFVHSIVGRYDQIVAGRYHLSPSDSADVLIEFEQAPHHLWLESAMERFDVDGVGAGAPEVRALTVLLFLSMLPLHSDRPDRQRAFVANALRLYGRLEGHA